MLKFIAIIVFISASAQGCVVAKTAGAAVGAGATVAKTGVKTTGAVVDAAIPDGEDE